MFQALCHQHVKLAAVFGQACDAQILDNGIRSVALRWSNHTFFGGEPKPQRHARQQGDHQQWQPVGKKTLHADGNDSALVCISIERSGQIARDQGIELALRPQNEVAHFACRTTTAVGLRDVMRTRAHIDGRRRHSGREGAAHHHW